MLAACAQAFAAVVHRVQQHRLIASCLCVCTQWYFDEEGYERHITEDDRMMTTARMIAPPAPELTPVPQQEVSRTRYHPQMDPGRVRPVFLHFLPDTQYSNDQKDKVGDILSQRYMNTPTEQNQQGGSAAEEPPLIWDDQTWVYDLDSDLAQQASDTHLFAPRDLPLQLQQQPDGAQAQQPCEEMWVCGEETDLSWSGLILHPHQGLQQAQKQKGGKGLGRLFKGLRMSKSQRRAAADCSAQPAAAQPPAPVAPSVSLGAKVKQWKESFGTAVGSGATRFCDAAKSKWNSAVTFVKSHGGARLMVA